MLHIVAFYKPYGHSQFLPVKKLGDWLMPHLFLCCSIQVKDTTVTYQVKERFLCSCSASETLKLLSGCQFQYSVPMEVKSPEPSTSTSVV